MITSGKILNHHSVHGTRCVGCIRTNTDVMITFMDDQNDQEFNDWFLTTEQAESLCESLAEVLKRNGN